MERVQGAARLAQIADFIEGREGGYEEIVGERGIRLSGGQRQRIGIARALYKGASVIVLDEATSALDNTTEKEVMAAIEGLSHQLTVILIAHRLSTLEKCDRIFQLDQGQVCQEGKG
ncbi:ATP-binding cassette domain-containing protein [Cylindrospermopsis raciborskii]|uniref:Multidrug ABC transporter ATP-binding protein n=1 Tax=Cylindrospermopsis raciborskii CS-505 TaxID=533240 RepID=A0A853MCB7_9CYAN|nr:ATP-binding cassette domain-containing protein [Cylindrospermopsis raciborskii]OBU77060.1 multidrug ABC transporter ATP-binding protein [Cylindrospermopsis raciborskii CS-505]OHY41811.1 multidrug ABC transporter ATP-binding protein [Cylindrospermopsis raciborskii CS-508]PNK01596.1 multidrug ABC transporter ATP-binding protein [Cylindrospermopsis raciborskii S10]PNK09262.1 multidrug ABC transporter ATP-binding protein [Cylindrospermopsis raciborskii S06]PNK19518.1 multidrug ABC transporter A